MTQKLANSSLAAALAEMREQYVARNPASLAAHVEAAAAMPGGNTRSVLFHAPFPLTMVRGESCRLWDADGHEYVDMLGEYTAGLYGHSNPIIRDAIDTALDAGWNMGGHGTMEARLARTLCDRFPSLDLVRFTNSGTEANLMAIATAVAVTGRKRVLVFDGGYHGGILYFGGGGIPINAPHQWVLAPYNDIAGTLALVERACGRPRLHRRGADARKRRLHPGPSQAFLQALRDAADPHRRRADLRRGDDQPHVRRRGAGAAGDHSGHDHARQVHRRRHELRRVRRPGGHHGSLRPAPARMRCRMPGRSTTTC